MHETSRRLLGRAIFVLLCALPTALVLAWIVARWLPGAEAAYGAWASAATGLRVTIGRVEFPAPGKRLFRDVLVADPESGTPLARVRVLETAARDGGEVWLASQPEIEPGALPRLTQAVEDRFLRGPAENWPTIDVAAGEATLKEGDSSAWLTLTDLVARFENRGEGPRVRWEFRVAGMQLSAPLTCEFSRNRQRNPPRSEARFDTAGSSVPMGLLVPWLPELRALGTASQVRGSLWLVAEDRGWQGEAALELSGLDLDRLTRGRFPHRISGSGRVSRCEIAFAQGRLTTASGRLVAGPGVVDRALVESARAALQLAGEAAPRSGSSKTLHYRQLACDFRLTERGLLLAGGCEDAGPGVLLADSRGALLAEPPPAVQPLAATSLVRMLAPASQLQVPASKETEWLLRYLPLPPLVPPESAGAQTPTARATITEAELR